MVSADWSLIGTGGSSIHLWDTATQTSKGTIDRTYVQFGLSPSTNQVFVLNDTTLSTYSIDPLQLVDETDLPGGHQHPQISPDNSKVLCWIKEWVDSDDMGGSYNYLVDVIPTGLEPTFVDSLLPALKEQFTYYPWSNAFIGFSADSAHLLKRRLAGGVELVPVTGSQAWEVFEQPLDSSLCPLPPTVSNDGNTVMTGLGLGGYVSKALALWNPDDGSLLATRPWDRSVAVSSDLNKVAIDDDDHFDIVDFESQQTLYTVPVGDNDHLVLSQDGSHCLTYSGSGSANVWDDQGQSVADYASSADIDDAAFSPDGATVATSEHANGQGKTVFWDASTGDVLFESVPFENKTHGPDEVSFSPDGNLALLSYQDGAGAIVNAHTGQTVKTFLTDCWPAVFSPDSRHLGGLFQNNSVSLYDIDTDEVEISNIASCGPVTTLAFFPDGRLLVDASVPYAAPNDYGAPDYHYGDGFVAIYDLGSSFMNEGEGEGEDEGDDDDLPIGCFRME